MNVELTVQEGTTVDLTIGEQDSAQFGLLQESVKEVAKDYDLLDNKPSINGVVLQGDKSFAELGLTEATPSKAGLMSASDKTTLNAVSTTYVPWSSVDHALNGQSTNPIDNQTVTHVIDRLNNDIALKMTAYTIHAQNVTSGTPYSFTIPTAEYNAVVGAITRGEDFALSLHIALTGSEEVLTGFYHAENTMFGYSYYAFSVTTQSNLLGLVTNYAVAINKTSAGGALVKNNIDTETIVTRSALEIALATKQDALTFDSTPTSGSANPVTSNGIYEAIQNIEPIPQVNADWNATSGVAEILNKPTIPAAQVNSDWNASSGVAQILNKPTIPAAQVNSDWNATSGVAKILNKPTQTSAFTNNGASGTSTYVEANQLAAVATSGAYSDLTGTPTIPGPELFKCEYNVTTFAAITQAISEGKLPYVEINGGAYFLYDASINYYQFGGPFADGNVYVTVSDGDSWSQHWEDYQSHNQQVVYFVDTNMTWQDVYNLSLTRGNLCLYFDFTYNVVCYIKNMDAYYTIHWVGEDSSNYYEITLAVDDTWSSMTVTPKPDLSLKADSAGATANYAAKLSAAIPFGKCDNTSTATAFTATVPGITELKNGVCMWLRNGVVTSKANFTLDVNNLGAKPVYSNMADATRESTMFNIAYTFLFVYDETRVSGGCWVLDRGYDSNTNTIGYQLRTNSTVLPIADACRYYKLLFTSADGTKWVPGSASSVNSATTAKDVNQRPINPFGPIVYLANTTAYAANADIAAGSIWQQYVLSLGYTFNRTGAALVLETQKPLYVKCAPQSDGSAIIDATTPYVQALPSSDDGKIYIFLGIAYSATNIELQAAHPIYYYKNGAIRQWTNLPIWDGGVT